MSALEKFACFNQRFSFLIEWIGLAAFFMMMLITCFDVTGSKVFKMPLSGALDMVMLAQLVAMSFAVGSGLILKKHVEVEFFIPLMPKILQRIVDCIVNFLGLFLFLIITWRLIEYGYSLQTGNEVSPTIRVPLYPFAYGAAFAFIPVSLIYLNRFMVSIRRFIR